MNDKANQFFNQFDSGRTEISIHGINSKELDYSIKTIQPISELNDNSKDLSFFQAQITSGDNQGNRREAINLGIGHRILVEDDMAIAGINLFTDYETKSAHKRLSLGLEYQRINFDVSANVYHPLSDKKTIADTTTTEEALAGYDIQLTGQAPYLPWATIKGTHYFWDAKVGDNIKGNVLGIEVKLTPSISFEFGQEDNNNTSSKSHGKLSFKLPFDDNEQLTNFAIADTPFKASSEMNLGAFTWVERSNKIRTEKVDSDGNVVETMIAGGITYSTVTIGTQTWTAENMKHAVTTGNAWSYDNDISNDANDYGKLYDWAGAMNGSTAEGAQGICATGWHIPSDGDWKTLEGELGMSTADHKTIQDSEADQGTQLKIGGGSGFEARLAGYRDTSGGSFYLDSYAYLWSSTEVGASAWYRDLFSGSARVSRDSFSKSFGFSVRCLKD